MKFDLIDSEERHIVDITEEYYLYFRKLYNKNLDDSGLLIKVRENYYKIYGIANGNNKKSIFVKYVGNKVVTIR